jgi:hypothetical protein
MLLISDNVITCRVAVGAETAGAGAVQQGVGALQAGLAVPTCGVRRRRRRPSLTQFRERVVPCVVRPTAPRDTTITLHSIDLFDAKNNIGLLSLFRYHSISGPKIISIALLSLSSHNISEKD